MTTDNILDKIFVKVINIEEKLENCVTKDDFDKRIDTGIRTKNGKLI